MGIIIRQSIKGTVVNYVGVVIGFFTTFFVATRFLSAEEIGLTRVLLDAAMLLSSLAQLGTGSSIIRFYPYFKDEEKEDHGFFFWTLLIPLLGFLLFSLLFYFLHDFVGNAFSEKSDLFVTYYKCIFPLGFALLYMTVFESNANVLMRIVVPKFVREVLVRLLTLLAYLLYAFHVVDLDGFIVAFCGVYLAALLVDVIYLLSLKHVSFKPDCSFFTPALIRNYLFYTLFLVTATLSNALAPFVNSFFISAKMGLTYTGIFAIASYITALVEIPYRSLGAIAQPQISRAIKDSQIAEANALCRNISFHQLLAGAFIFLLIWMNLDFMFKILPNGEQYATAKWVVFILAISKLFVSVCSIGVSVLNYSRFYYYSLIFSAFYTIISVIFTNSFIPLWGMNGAALATLLSSVLYYGALLILNYLKIKTCPFSLKQLQVIGLLLCFGLVDFILEHLTQQILPQTLLWGFAEAIFRTGMVSSLAVIIIYRLKFSEELNTVIDYVIMKLRRNKKEIR